MVLLCSYAINEEEPNMAYPTAICSYEEYRKKYRAEQMRQLFSETAHFFYDAPEKYGFE